MLLNITLKYSIINKLTIEKRIYLSTRKRLIIKLIKYLKYRIFLKRLR